MFSQHSHYAKKQNATFEQRIIAFVIDATIIGTAASFLTAVFGSGGALTFLYFAVTQLLFGHSPGKFIVGLRVISTTGQTSIWRMVLRETLGKFISAFFLGLGYLSVMLSPTRLAWHDRMSSTRVITLRPQNVSGLSQLLRGAASLVVLFGMLAGYGYYIVLHSPYTLVASLESKGFRVQGAKGSMAKGFHFHKISREGGAGSLILENVKMHLNSDLQGIEKMNFREKMIFDEISIGGGRLNLEGPPANEEAVALALISIVRASLHSKKEMPANEKCHDFQIKSIELQNFSLSYNSKKVGIERVSIADLVKGCSRFFRAKHLYISSDLGDLYLKDFNKNFENKKVSYNFRGSLKANNSLFPIFRKTMDFKGKFESQHNLPAYNLSAFDGKLRFFSGAPGFLLNIDDLKINHYLLKPTPITLLNFQTHQGHLNGSLTIRNKKVKFSPLPISQLFSSPLVEQTPRQQRAHLLWWNLLRDKPWLKFQKSQSTTPALSVENLSQFYLKKPFTSLSKRLKKRITSDYRFLSTGLLPGYWDVMQIDKALQRRPAAGPFKDEF